MLNGIKFTKKFQNIGYCNHSFINIIYDNENKIEMQTLSNLVITSNKSFSLLPSTLAASITLDKNVFVTFHLKQRIDLNGELKSPYISISQSFFGQFRKAEPFLRLIFKMV